MEDISLAGALSGKTFFGDWQIQDRDVLRLLLIAQDCVLFSVNGPKLCFIESLA